MVRCEDMIRWDKALGRLGCDESNDDGEEHKEDSGERVGWLLASGGQIIAVSGKCTPGSKTAGMLQHSTLKIESDV